MATMTVEELEKKIEGMLEKAFEKNKDAQAWLASEAAKKDHVDPEAELLLAPKPGGTPTPATEKMVGGLVRALAASKRDEYQRLGQTTQERAIKIAREIHKDDMVAKALELQDFASGGALVSEETYPGVIELLRARQVVRSLNPTIIPMVNGATSIAKITGGATAAYLGEMSYVGASGETTGNVNFRERKLGCLVPVSNDLLRVPSANANQTVMDDLRSAMGEKSDWAFMRGDGTAYVPVGIENLAGTTFDANGTVNLANVTTDLGQAVLYLYEGNSRMIRPGWLFAPRTWMYLMTVRDGNGNYAFREEMLTGKLWGWPFGFTTQIPTNLGTGTDESKLYVCDFADLVIAESMSIEIVTSSEAAYYDGSAVRAAFSEDSTVIRAIEKHDFNTRHAESIVCMSAVTWSI